MRFLRRIIIGKYVKADKYGKEHKGSDTHETYHSDTEKLVSLVIVFESLEG